MRIPNIHPDWTDEPQPIGRFDRIYRNGIPTDTFVTFIRGFGADGKIYYRAVEVTGRMMLTQEATQKVNRVQIAVTEKGPSVCKAVDGGDLPMESAQPPLER